MASFEFLGPYRVGELLGRGGMGSVYAAVHEKTGQEVAVKLIAEHVADEERFRRRFDREARILQRLHHEGIVSIVGVGEEQGRLFYSMEMVHGESLQKRIRRDKRMDWRVTLDIAIQICAALKHAHDTGVFHRDLKPANLILEADDKVKLVDFGISRLYGYEGEQTAAGAVLGTADYMAPEQATGGPITARTDLYALGSVMYAMLAGRAPFTGKKITEVIESLKRDRPVPLDLINPELPDELVELVHELLEKDPKDRPPTALVVSNRLKAMRVGLQRHATLGDGQLATELGVDDDFAAGESMPPASDAAAPATNMIGGATDGRPRTVVSKGGAAKKKFSAEAITLVSGPDGQTLQPDGSVATERDTETPKTHFQTVEVTHAAGGLFDTDAKPDRHWIGQTISLTVMIATLAVVATMFFRATRQPSAEDLYQVIAAAKNAGEASKAQNSIDQFLKRFPDHEHAPQVRVLNHSLDLDRCLRRLRVRAKLGISPLEPSESAFLEAMTGRELNPLESTEALETWLTVYAESTTPMTETEEELADLVRSEIAKLADQYPAVIIDPRAQKLIDRIHTSVEHDTPDVARHVLQGIKELHANQPWAKPAVDEATEQLKAMDEFANPSPDPAKAEPAASYPAE